MRLWVKRSHCLEINSFPDNWQIIYQEVCRCYLPPSLIFFGKFEELHSISLGGKEFLWGKMTRICASPRPLGDAQIVR